MALNYNYSKCKDIQAVEADWFLTEGIIFNTMTLGIPDITKDNVDEFHNRLDLVDRLFGTSLRVDNKDRPITLDELKVCIGLKTNSSSLTRTAFNKRVLDRYWREK